MPTPKGYSYLIPPTVIFRFLTKHLFCSDISFWTAHFTLPSSSLTFFHIPSSTCFESFPLIFKIFPTLDFRTGWNNSCSDVIKKKAYHLFLPDVLLRLLCTLATYRFPVQLVIYYFLTAIPLQWNHMSAFIHWWPSLFFWNIHLWSPVPQWNAD